MKQLKLSLVVLICLSSFQIKAQKPEITSIDKSSGNFGEIITISGLGFDTIPSNLDVIFGAQKGSIVSAFNNVIEARVPAGTSYNSISVLHKNSGLIGYSSEQFFLNFSGGTFDETLFEGPFDFNPNGTILDLCSSDFDGDGKIDIATTKVDPSATTIAIFHNASTDAVIDFTPVTLVTNFVTGNIACGDINGDGKPDIALTTRTSGQLHQLMVLQNTSTPGNISFSNPQTYFAPESSQLQKVKIRDVDLNGKPEIIASNSNNDEIFVFKNNSTQSTVSLESAPLIFVGVDIPKSGGLDVEDLNNDGFPEIILNNTFAENLYILTNTSSAGSISFGTDMVIASTPATALNNIIVGDINLDGKNDIIATNTTAASNPGEVAVFLNDTQTDGGTISILAPQVFDLTQAPWGLDIGDVNGDGLPDIVVSAFSNLKTTPSVLINNSSGNTLSFNNIDLPLMVKNRNMKIVDVSGDAKPDIVFTVQDASSTLSVLRNQNCFVPVTTPAGSITVCNGQTVRIGSTNALQTNFAWEVDGVLQKNSTEPFYEFTADGANHSITVTAISEDSTCLITSDPLSVVFDASTAPATPDLTDPSPACIGNDVTLNAPLISGATYNWSGPNGFTSNLQNPSITNVTSDNAGRYSLFVVVGNCSSDTASVVLEVIPPPTSGIETLGSTTICTGSSVDLSVPEQPGFTIQWNKDGVALTGETSNTFSASEAGNYTVTLTGIEANCEFITDPVTITTVEAPAAGITPPATLCSNTALTFTDNSTVAADQTPVYHWDFGDGNTSTEMNPSHTYTTTGTFNVSHTITYQNVSGCKDSTGVSITVNEGTPVTISYDGTGELCEGDSVTLDATGTFDSYLWSTGETTPMITVSQGGDFYVEATNASGCVTTDTVTITLLPAPEITVAAERTEIGAGETVQLSATSPQNLTYLWSPVEFLDDSASSTPIAMPDTTTTFTVTGTDINGCTVTAAITIIVGDVPVEAMKVFSPNGDLINDRWVVRNIQDFVNCTLIIFNRQGNRVFEATPYNNDWNGTNIDGSELPEGVYYFIFKCDNEVAKTGSILVIR